MVSQSIIDSQAAALLADVPEGEDLSEEQVILLNYALCVSATALDVDRSRQWQQRALAAGITPDQLHEIVTLMSSTGCHAFFESSRDLAQLAVPAPTVETLDEERRRLWDKYIGDRPYWEAMELEIPGFLLSLLHMSPAAFEGFITYAAIPFRSKLVPTLTKEIIGMAADACTSHQYLPGMRMHLRTSVRMGAGRRAIEHALRIAAEAPGHIGVE